MATTVTCCHSSTAEHYRHMAEDVASDLAAEAGYSDPTVPTVDAFDLLLRNCPHDTADLRLCNGCTVGDPDLNQTGLRWCDGGKIVNVAEEETTCGCALTPSEWQVLSEAEVIF